MNSDIWLRRACWLGSVAVVLAAGTLVQAQDVLIRKAPAPGATGARVVWLEGAATPGRFVANRDVLFFVGDADGEATATYWIGLICDPADATVRAQLKLKDTGLVVRHLVPDAPAAKAGVKEHDILLAVGDKEVGDVRDLVAAVEKSEGKEVTLHLLRAGEKTSIKVTPTKRDKTARVEEFPPDVRAYLERFPVGPEGWRRWEGMRPGVIGMRVGEPHKLPKDMSVTITKEGESPAKIVIKQGDKTWEATEDKLKDLPEEVRKHVAPMVRPGAAVFEKRLSAPVPSPPFELELPRPGSDRRLEKQVDELRKQLDQMQKKLEELAKPKS